MKIKHKELQKLYKAYITENTPESRKNCPHPKEIINFFKSKTSEKQKTKIIDHIANCYSCAQEFEFILQIRRDERKLIEEIGKLLQSKENISAIKKRAGKTVSYIREKRISFFPKLSWKYAFLLVGIFIIISAIIIFLKSEKQEYRGENLEQINLIEPIKGKYSKSLLVFKWNAFKDSDYYILELFDETLFPVWKSNKIFKNHAVLPSETGKKLNENKTYFWMVTVFLPDGRKIESKIEEFTLTD